MGLFDRFKTVVKSNINYFLDQVEDPAKLVDQAILDMQAQKREAQVLLNQALTGLKIAQKRGEVSPEQKKSQESNLSDLEKAIAHLSAKIEKAKKKAVELKRKLVLTQAKKTSEGISAIEQKDHVNNTESFEIFDRMEEKIEESEALNEATAELDATFNQKEAEQDALKIQADSLAANESLSKLKEKIKVDQASLEALSSKENDIEDELNRLKKRK